MTHRYMLALLLVGAVISIQCSPHRQAAAAGRQEAVPHWLLTALQKHLDNPSVLEKEDISYYYVWLRPGERPQVVASARLDRLNGVIAVFEYAGTAYREVYVKREPVYELSIVGYRRQLVCFVSGFGGTGVQNNFYCLVGYSGGGYTELWKGIAVASLFTGPLPYTYTSGALRFDPGQAQFLYTKTTLRYQQYEFDWRKPTSHESVTWLFTLDPESYRVKDSTLIRD